MVKKAGWALVGFGGMGGWHYDNMKTMDDVIEICGTYDIKPERNEAAEQAGLHAYASLEELLADPKVDFITIATPNDCHRDIAIKAMEAGKHVISEKPVTVSSEDLQAMIDASNRTKRTFSVHQNRRWDEDFRVAKKLYDENTLGKIFSIESRVHGSRGVPGDWRNKKEHGGGMVLDWGVHMLDQIMWMIKSPVVSVYAELFEVYSNEVDDNCRLHIHFENGIAAMIQVDTNCFINQARWHVMCTDGTLIINDWSCNGKMVRLLDNKELEWTNEIVYTEAGPTRTMAPRPRETTEEIPIPQVNPQWSDFYNNVCSVIEDNNNELIVKPEEALRVMKVIDALFESAKTHSSVECNI